MFVCCCHHVVALEVDEKGYYVVDKHGKIIYDDIKTEHKFVVRNKYKGESIWPRKIRLEHWNLH